MVPLSFEYVADTVLTFKCKLLGSAFLKTYSCFCSKVNLTYEPYDEIPHCGHSNEGLSTFPIYSVN